MVLLKNDGILPLRDVTRIAVIGWAAQDAHFQGGGSSHITPTQVDAPIEELRKLAGDAEITYCEGYPVDDSSQPALIAEAVRAAQAADVALLYVALPTFKESEGYDRADLDLTAHQVALIQAVTAVQPRSVVILNNGYLGMVRQWQELFYEKRYACTCMEHAPDFVKLAEAYGAVGLRATRPAEVEAVLKKGLSIPRPVMMDFAVEREESVYPMVPAGAGVDEMILGDQEADDEPVTA
jgi:hypothetical protein